MPEYVPDMHSRLRELERQVAALDRRRDFALERQAEVKGFHKLRFGKVNALWTHADSPKSAMVSTWEWDDGTSAYVDSTLDIIVWMPPWLTSWAVAAGVWVELRYCGVEDKWIATPPKFLYGKLDGALAAAGSATVSVYYLNGSTWTDTTKNLTAYAPPLLSSGSIAISKWVRIEWCFDSARWEVVSAEC